MLISCIVLSLWPELGWLPLIIAFFPWVIRIIWQQNPFQFSVLDFLIIAFLFTSFVGLLVAYNPDQAFHKFYLIIGSIYLFYSLRRQNKENLWTITIALGLYGVLTTIIFILTNNWLTFPADFQIVKEFGYLLMRIRPQIEFGAFLDTQMFHANIVAGINAILIPLCATAAWHFWKAGRKTLFVFSLSILAILGFGLFITSSRAAWLAVISGLSFLIALNQGRIKFFFATHKYFFPMIPILIIATGVLAPYFLADSLYDSTLQITDLNSFESRLKIARQTYFLISDFPFTGGGLGSFPGLYSQYILVIPFFMFGYSHNLYLDLALEQGIFGFAVWLSIIFLCASVLGSTIKKQYETGENFLFASTIFASLIVFLLHGIMDDSIYSNVWGMTIFLVIPGLIIAQSDRLYKTTFIQKYTKFGIIGLAIIIGLSIVFIKPLLATWNANIGAVQMAKVELENWPTEEWVNGNQSVSYEQATNHLIRSISLEKSNQTANYRLGLILIAARDYPEAAKFLETARLSAPNHRGITKSLGYCYVWLGQFNEASRLLSDIPEAKQEMVNFIWWWENQGQKDLSIHAFQMVAQLTD